MTYPGKFPTSFFTLRPLLYTPTNPNRKPGTCDGLARLLIMLVEFFSLIGSHASIIPSAHQSWSAHCSLRVVWGVAPFDYFLTSQS